MSAGKTGEEFGGGERGSAREVARAFLKLGVTSFGGPAAHIALMRDEMVARRKWVSDQHFLDLLGATNLIPGPNSTEMAIHLGFARAGWRGMIAAGVAFIMPAMLIVLTLAWSYGEYGSTPQAEWLLYGIKPVIIAVVAHALYALGRTAIKGALTGVVAGAALALYLLGIDEVALLLAGALLVMFVRNGGRLLRGAPVLVPYIAGAGEAALPALWLAAQQAPFNLATLFLTFLKIGAVLYGSGYVLLAFLRGDFVERLGWLTDQQLLDAVAITQFTPGPLFTTATFVGYLVGGWVGGLVATVGIFLPSFVFVAAVNPLVPRLRRSPWTAALLDGVNAAALGLMAAVTLALGRAALVDPLTVALAGGALFALLRFRLNSVWLVLGGGLVGIAVQLLSRQM